MELALALLPMSAVPSMPEPELPGVSMLVGGSSLVPDLPPVTCGASEASLASCLD